MNAKNLALIIASCRELYHKRRQDFSSEYDRDFVNRLAGELGINQTQIRNMTDLIAAPGFDESHKSHIEQSWTYANRPGSLLFFPWGKPQNPELKEALIHARITGNVYGMPDEVSAVWSQALSIPVWRFIRIYHLALLSGFGLEQSCLDLALEYSGKPKSEYERFRDSDPWIKKPQPVQPSLNFSSQDVPMSGTFINSGRNNPCPVCSRTHDDGCSWADDLKTVLCRSKAHDGQLPQPPDQINGYKFTGKVNNAGVLERAVYVLDDWKKPAAAKSDLTFEYPTTDGKPCVRTRRIDKGDGKNKKLIWQEYWIEDSQLAKFTTSGHWVKMAKNAGTHEERQLYEKYRRELASQVHLFKIDEALTLHQSTGYPLLIVEGETSCLALLKLGIPATTSIGGAGKFEQYGWPNYLSDLEPFNQVVVCPDCDEDGRKHAEMIAKHRPDCRWLYANPGHARWRSETWQSGYDVANWIQEGAAIEQILAAVEDKRIERVQSIRASADCVVAESGMGDVDPLAIAPEDSKPQSDYKRIKRFFGARIRYNEMRGIVEIDGKSADLDNVRLDLMIDHALPLKCGAEEVAGIVLKIAKEQSYHPVKNYLESVHTHFGDSTEALQCFADRYFGQSDAIYTIFAIRFLIAAVARIYEPGCKHDTALILQGKQGWGKSTFFKKLAGDDWFDDSLASTSDKDEKLKLNQTWFMEWAELETVFKRKDVSQTKAFLSSSSDKVRPPYGRSVIDMPRRSVIVGSTNQDEFLNDSTGNRRFWIIPLTKRVPIGELIENRDQIWAAAVHLYKSGMHWHLWQAEEDAASDIAENYQSTDTWQSYIAEYVRGLPHTTVSSVLENALDLEKGKQDKAAQMRVADILRSLGWKSQRKRIDGMQIRVWVKPENPPEYNPEPGCTQVVLPETLVNSPLFQLSTTETTSKEDLINRGEVAGNKLLSLESSSSGSESFFGVESCTRLSQELEPNHSKDLTQDYGLS